MWYLIKSLIFEITKSRKNRFIFLIILITISIILNIIAAKNSSALAGDNAATTVAGTGSPYTLPPFNAVKWSSTATTGAVAVIFDSPISEPPNTSTSSQFQAQFWQNNTCSTTAGFAQFIINRGAMTTGKFNGSHAPVDGVSPELAKYINFRYRSQNTAAWGATSPCVEIKYKDLAADTGGITEIIINEGDTVNQGSGDIEEAITPLYKVIGAGAAVAVIAFAVWLVISPFMKRHIR